jgi:RNA polymerase sigma factor (sigma-70 family)
MANPTLQAAARQIQCLATVHEAREQSDGQLLRAFLAANDQLAFTELVRRHAPLVLSVCRRVLHHSQDAEDAFQATFLLLARQAGSIRKPESLAGWLHGVSYRIASTARRAAARRRKYESQSGPVQPPNPAWNTAWREVQAILDEEIDRLPEPYRQSFVLCCLENQSCAEVAQQFGQKEGTIWSRVARARQRLQRRLTRRGVSLASVLAAAELSGNTVLSAAPPALIAATVQAAASLPQDGVGNALAAVPSLVSPRVAALLEGSKNALAFPKHKLAMLLLLATLVVSVASAALLAQRPRPVPSDEVPQQPQPRAQGKEAPPAPPQRPLEEEGDTVTVSGRVLDPDGKPFSGAKLLTWVNYNARPIPATVRATSGPDGSFQFSFGKRDDAFFEEESPNTWQQPWHCAHVLATAPGYGACWMHIVEFARGDAVLRLVKDDIPVQGRIRDLQGQPVVGAVIGLKNIGGLLLPAWPGLQGSATTDKDGRFTLTGIGRDREAGLRISSPTIALQLVGVNTAKAASATLDLFVGPTKPIEGTIRDRDTGKPLSDVVLYAKPADLENWQYDLHGVRAITDAQGRYRLEGLPKAKRYGVTVRPRTNPGYLPATKWLEDTEGLKSIREDFALRKGVVVRFRLIDKEDRQPLQGHVQYTLARGNPFWEEALEPYNPQMILPPTFGDLHCPDKNGFIQFVAFPGHGAIFAMAGPGYEPYLKARLSPEDEKKGYFPLTRGDPNNGFIYACDGYRVIDTNKTDKTLTFDIEFTRGRDLSGRLIGPDDKTVTGATAYGLTFDASLLYRTERHPRLEQQVLKTDAFTALGLYPNEPRTLSFAHPERKLIGYTIVRGIETGPLLVRLGPWGALTGRLVDEQGKPMPGVPVRLHYPELPQPGMLGQGTEFPTDNQGRFRVEGLLPDHKHGLALVGDARRALAPAAADQLTNLSISAGEVKDLGDIKVKVTPLPEGMTR